MNTTTTTADTANDKRREDRLRRQLYKAGYRLMKGKGQPRYCGKGQCFRGETGYQITDVQIGGVVAGWSSSGDGFDLSLEEAEAWLHGA
jgi:hypothetical protein